MLILFEKIDVELFLFLQLALLKLLDELREWRKLLGIDKLELVDKEDEVLEARVEVVLCAERHDLVKMSVVDVRVHAEQSLEYHLNDLQEVLWKRHAYTQGSVKSARLPISIGNNRSLFS